MSTGRLVLMIGGEPVPVEMTVPSGPVTVGDLLPVLYGLSDLFVQRGVARAQAQGRTVSCRAGCGACCRQLVPVSAAEARALTQVVEAMPEPRRAQVRRRFDEALAALEPDGVLERLLEPTEDGRLELGHDYFRQGVACPFLEDEACSIHAERPMACREYLVTSPAENCRTPSAASIEKVVLEGDPSLALQKAEAAHGWLPLVLSLVFTGQAEPAARDRTAPEVLADVTGRL